MVFEGVATAQAGGRILRLVGELDLATAPTLAEAVERELAGGPQRLTLDLAGTTFLDSSGARELARSARRAGDHGATVFLACPAGNQPVRRVLDLLQLAALMPVLDSGEPAEDHPAPPQA